MSNAPTKDSGEAPQIGHIPADASLHRTILDQLHDGVYLVDRNRRITYWNRGAERISGYSAAEVVGSRCSDNLLIHVDHQGTLLCHGACPLAHSMEDGDAREAEVFLHHKDGHRVPVIVRTSPVRGAGDRVIGGIEVFTAKTDSDELREEIESLRRLALFDSLTGIPNRRFLEMALQARQDEFSRYGWPYGVLLIDVDHFKHFNDQHGHATGDLVLRVVAQTLSGNLRSFDGAGRWGGEEFLVVAERTDPETLQNLAERLRRLVEVSSLTVDDKLLSVTVSIGAASVQAGESSANVVDRADALLYRAKSHGRNCVAVDD